MRLYLSKSDFKVSRTCPTKLYYRKLAYPSTQDTDPYLGFLADGGYMVEAIAKLLEPDGVEVGFDKGLEIAAAETEAALQRENVTLFEATVIFENYCARIDILRKRGNNVELIEVKAKSVDGRHGTRNFRSKHDHILNDWHPYLEDVAFQTWLLQERFPQFQVIPFLRLVDTSRTTHVESVFSRFKLQPRPATLGSKLSRPEILFTGDLEALRTDHIIAAIDVTREVKELMPDVITSANRFAGSLEPHLHKLIEPIGVHCRDCEYRNAATVADRRDGFRECWGALADEDPHILDYYHPSAIGERSNPLIDILVSRGRAKLSDVEEADLGNGYGANGAIARRQRIQREYTLRNEEYIDPRLFHLLVSFSFPLHFIDFETSRVAVTYHPGMRPYEQVAFQWSCHTIRQPGADLEHTEWINLAEAFPNFAFVETLRAQIGEIGTVFMWSPHEQTTLRDIGRQMIEFQYSDSSLAEWIEKLAGGKSEGPERMVDLCAIAKEHYFHPRMKGRLSIKYVLPGIWESNSQLHAHPAFTKYFRRDVNGRVVNPYETLPPLPTPDSSTPEEIIREGSGAMRAYQEMLYGLSKNDPAKRERWRQLLLQYCQLDTAAMVMIWMHWESKCRSEFGN
jgi:Domain of unknown function(DUF2779)